MYNYSSAFMAFNLKLLCGSTLRLGLFLHTFGCLILSILNLFFVHFAVNRSMYSPLLSVPFYDLILLLFQVVFSVLCSLLCCVLVSLFFTSVCFCYPSFCLLSHLGISGSKFITIIIRL